MSTLATTRYHVPLRTSVTVGLVGTGTSWTAGTPGSPTFMLSGGTGASIVSQVVNSATSATLVIATGSAMGLLTITDPGTSATAKLEVMRSNYAKWFPGLQRAR